MLRMSTCYAEIKTEYTQSHQSIYLDLLYMDRFIYKWYCTTDEIHRYADKVAEYASILSGKMYVKKYENDEEYSIARVGC